MKKNKMMRIASVLLVAVLISTCAISGTFAKYVTKGEGEDTARVAKWGVVINAEGELFSDKYETDDDNLTADEAAIVGKYSVQAYNTTADAAGDKLVAPGTSFEAAKATITGKPEVAVRVGYVIDIKAENWEFPLEAPATEVPATETTKAADDTAEATTEEYFPIVFTVNKVQYKVGKAPAADVKATTVKYFDTIELLIAGIKADVEAASVVYAANTDLSTEFEGIDISWEWPFETGETDEEIAANDEKDTALGDQAAAGIPATLEVTFAITVTQID